MRESSRSNLPGPHNSVESILGGSRCCISGVLGRNDSLESLTGFLRYQFQEFRGFFWSWNEAVFEDKRCNATLIQPTSHLIALRFHRQLYAAATWCNNYSRPSCAPFVR